MSKDSGDESPREAPSAYGGEASTSADPNDPLVTAASRGDDPLGMFASDDDGPFESATGGGLPDAPQVPEPVVRPAVTSPGEAGPLASLDAPHTSPGQRSDAPSPVVAAQSFSVERRSSLGEVDDQSQRQGAERQDFDGRPDPAVSVAAAVAPLGADGSVPREMRPDARRMSSEQPVPLEPAEWSDLRAPAEPRTTGEERLAAALRASGISQPAHDPGSSAPPPVPADQRDAGGGVSPPPSPPRPQTVQPGAPAPLAGESRPLVRATARATGPELRRPAIAAPAPDDRRSVPPPASQMRRHLKSTPVLVFAAILVVGAVAFGAWRLVRGFGNQPAPPAAVQEGRLTIESLPTGVPVEIDGVKRGATPLGVKVTAGRHLVRVGGPGGREIDVVVAAGGDVSHHIDLPEVRTRLHVATVPSAATVKVDGQTRGVAPLDLDGLIPGIHTISVEAGGATVRRDVDVRSGADNSVVISLGGGGPTTGWLTVASPFDVDVYEGSRLVGRSRDGQMLVVSGAHDLTLTNADLGYKEASRVTITAGATATVRVQPRNGQLSVNAIPWAEVFLDGVRIGETPMANYAVSIGQHEVRLVHPQLGEQRRTVVVTLTSPTRIGVSFSK